MNDDLPIDDPIVPDPDELEDDEDVVVPAIPVDPEEDHESLDALADEEEEEIDADLDDTDAF